MGCVRKRGKSWNAQVRVAGWRSFTKSFSKKSLKHGGSGLFHAINIVIYWGKKELFYHARTMP